MILIYKYKNQIPKLLIKSDKLFAAARLSGASRQNYLSSDQSKKNTI